MFENFVNIAHKIEESERSLSGLPDCGHLSTKQVRGGERIEFEVAGGLHQ